MLTSPSALAVTVPASPVWHCRRVRLWHSPLLVTSRRSLGTTGWPFSCHVTATSSGDTRHLKVASSLSSTVRFCSSMMISTTLGTTARLLGHGIGDPLSYRDAEHSCNPGITVPASLPPPWNRRPPGDGGALGSPCTVSVARVWSSLDSQQYSPASPGSTRLSTSDRSRPSAVICRRGPGASTRPSFRHTTSPRALQSSHHSTTRSPCRARTSDSPRRNFTRSSAQSNPPYQHPLPLQGDPRAPPLPPCRPPRTFTSNCIWSWGERQV